ncbi:dephospho-CoA kinase [bacterium]|nr:dephospho-CoA kinase [bacterium]
MGWNAWPLPKPLIATLPSARMADDNSDMHPKLLSSAVATNRPAVPVVGIIGGIGSGKSSVARWVAEHHSGRVIDADQLGHLVLKDPAIIASLSAAFGSSILTPQGEIDRKSLASLVFGEEASQEDARRQLEQIVHPAIRRAMEQRLAEIDPQTDQLVLLDAAVLLEAGWSDICDAILFIDTPLETRRKRVARQRGWSPEELERRERSQWSLERKQAAATAVLPNTGDIVTTGTAVWNTLRRLFTKLS